MSLQGIKRLSLRNYRSFVSADMDDLDTIVSIKGHNGAGKTNIMEAILDVCTGIGFRTECLYMDRLEGTQTKSGEVTVEFRDGRIITMSRESGSTETKWTLQKPGEKPVQLSGVRDSVVAEEVCKFTGFVTVAKVTLQRVYSAKGVDSEALIGETMRPQTALRILNSSTGEGHLDTALRNCKNDLDVAKRELPKVSETLKVKQTRLDALQADKNIASVKKRAIKLEKLHKKKADYELELSYLQKLTILRYGKEVHEEVLALRKQKKAELADLDADARSLTDEISQYEEFIKSSNELRDRQKRLNANSDAVTKFLKKMGLVGKNIKPCSDCGGLKLCLQEKS